MILSPAYLRPSGRGRSYGLTPSREYMASIGAPPEKTNVQLVTRLAASLAASLLVGPFVVKQFSPEMPWKRRLGISVAATMVIDYAARTINPR